MVLQREDHGLILFLTREKIHRTTVLKRVLRVEHGYTTWSIGVRAVITLIDGSNRV